jgi:hypothetical protein
MISEFCMKVQILAHTLARKHPRAIEYTASWIWNNWKWQVQGYANAKSDQPRVSNNVPYPFQVHCTKLLNEISFTPNAQLTLNHNKL